MSHRSALPASYGICNYSTTWGVCPRQPAPHRGHSSQPQLPMVVTVTKSQEGLRVSPLSILWVKSFNSQKTHMDDDYPQRVGQETRTWRVLLVIARGVKATCLKPPLALFVQIAK